MTVAINRWTEEYNLERLERGETPLALSIEHWEDNVRWLELNPHQFLPRFALSGGACACCVEAHVITGVGCDICIISQKLGGCDSAGYNDVYDAPSPNAQLQATRRLLQNIKGLQKEVEANG